MKKITGYEKDEQGNYILPYKPIYKDLGSAKVDKWQISIGGVGGHSLGQIQAERAVSGKNYVPAMGKDGGHHVLTVKKRKKR